MQIDPTLAVGAMTVTLASGALIHKIFFSGDKGAVDVLNAHLNILDSLLQAQSNSIDAIKITGEKVKDKVFNQHQILHDQKLDLHDQRIQLKTIDTSQDAIHRRLDGFKDRQQEHANYVKNCFETTKEKLQEIKENK